MQLKILVSTLIFMGTLTLTTAQIHAASITYTDPLLDASTPLLDQPLRVDLFNPALGTLTKVTVTLSGSLTSDGTVTNSATQAQSFTFSTRAERYDGTKAGGSPTVLPNTFNILTPFDLIGSQTYTNLVPSTPTAFGPFTKTPDPPPPALEYTADLAQFVGVGTFGYDLNTLILSTFSGGGSNLNNNITTRANAILSVQYEFEGDVAVVPEPATVSLVGLGLLGLAYTRRRMPKLTDHLR